MVKRKVKTKSRTKNTRIDEIVVVPGKREKYRKYIGDED